MNLIEFNSLIICWIYRTILVEFIYSNWNYTIDIGIYYKLCRIFECYGNKKVSMSLTDE